jgi:protein O-mannosyl-transferase
LSGSSGDAAERGKQAEGRTAERGPGWHLPLFLLFILAAVAAAYAPILHNDFTNWDDPTVIQTNPLIRHLDWGSVHRIFTSNYLGNYQPLHLFSYALEYRLYGLNPSGYHATSLILFLLSSVLVFLLARELSGNDWIAALTALLFVLNPMRVESVAWATERKDTLYLLFCLGALLAYLRYLGRKEDLRWYLATFFLFVLSVLSKLSAVSFPAALLMIDYIQGRAFTRRLILDKLPFLAVSVWMGLKEIQAISQAHLFSSAPSFSFLDRILIGGGNYFLYLGKLIVPLKLSAFYPYPVVGPGRGMPASYILAFAGTLALLVLFLFRGRRSKVAVFCLGFYTVTVALFLQFVPVGQAVFSERYALVPSIALCYILAVAAVSALEKRPSIRRPVVGILAVYLLVLGLATHARCAVWQNSLTLWDDVLDKYPDAVPALVNRGKYFGETLRQPGRALADLDRAVRLEPGAVEAWTNRGIVRCMQGELAEGIEDFTRALSIDPGHEQALADRGLAYAQTGRHEQALEDFSSALKISPETEQVWVYRGMTYAAMGKPESALEDYDHAVALNPANGQALAERAVALRLLRREDEAQRDARAAERLGAKVDLPPLPGGGREGPATR